MGFVKRRASTKAKVSLPDFDRYKAQFLFDVKAVIEMEEIPCELIINWDQTGIHYVPVSSWTMEKEGSKRVEELTTKGRLLLCLVAPWLETFFLHK